MESPQTMYNDQNIQMAKSNGQNINNNNNSLSAINHNLKNDHMSNGTLHLQKQIQHPQQIHLQQQQIQQVTQYSQNDLEELGGPEISLDLANFMLVLC